MSFIGIMRDFVNGFDGFRERKISLGGFNSDTDEAGITVSGGPERLREYADGETLMKRLFTVTFTRPFGTGDMDEEEAEEFISGFADWLEEKSSEGDMPSAEGMAVESVLLEKVVKSVRRGSGVYSLVCGVKYFQVD